MMDGFISEALTGFHATPHSCVSRPRRRVLGFLTRKERHVSLYDHNASSKRHLPMRVHCMDPSPPKSRWDAYIRDEPSGEKRREGERGESITQRAEQRLLPLTDLAEQSGLLDDGGAPLHTACLVGAILVVGCLSPAQSSPDLIRGSQVPRRAHFRNTPSPDCARSPRQLVQ